MFYFFLFFVSIIISSKADEPDLGTIIFANVLYRHGDRNPVKSYPNDPWRNESFWPAGFGELTNLGKQQLWELGRWFRKRYDHILPPRYSSNDIYVRSAALNRTLLSAEANLAGLYPPVDGQIFNDIFKEIPIPIETIPLQEENVLFPVKYCARYTSELNQVSASLSVEYHQELYDYLTQMAGTKIDNILELSYFHDCLFIEEINNRTLPAWTKSVYPDKLEALVIKYSECFAHNKIMQRLGTGLLMKEMVAHMTQKSENALVPDRKLFMYSGVDRTITNLLTTLGLFEPHRVPYAATVLIELRLTSNRQHVVTVSYKNSTGEPMLLTLPRCTTACPLSQFVSLTKDVIPEDWDEECNGSSTTKLNDIQY